MSKQKIWVEKMPESCRKCFLCYDNRPYWKSTDCIINHKELDEDEIEIKREKDCPLHSIKDHDREKDKRIKELEQKVQEIQEVDNKRAFRLYSVLYEQLEKEDCENVASRIDYLTGKDYSDICELYKTAKNIKQHDKELVAKVCEDIKDRAYKNVGYHICECGKKFDIECVDFEDLCEIIDQIQKEYEK